MRREAGFVVGYDWTELRKSGFGCRVAMSLSGAEGREDDRAKCRGGCSMSRLLRYCSSSLAGWVEPAPVRIAQAPLIQVRNPDMDNVSGRLQMSPAFTAPTQSGVPDLARSLGSLESEHTTGLESLGLLSMWRNVNPVRFRVSAPSQAPVTDRRSWDASPLHLGVCLAFTLRSSGQRCRELSNAQTCPHPYRGAGRRRLYV